MNKKELVDSISEKSGLTKKDSQLALESTIASVYECLQSGGDLTLVGFGKFSTRDVAEKSGVCKLQGTETAWTTEAHKKPVFKAGKDFREIVKNGNAE